MKKNRRGEIDSGVMVILLCVFALVAIGIAAWADIEREHIRAGHRTPANAVAEQ